MKISSHLTVAAFVCVCMTLLFAAPGHCQETRRIALQLYGKAIRTAALSAKIELLKRAVELDPEFDEAVYELGISYFRKGDYQNAISSLRRMNDAESASFEDAGLYLRNAYTFRALELNEQESFEAAHAAASQALFLDADYAPALLALGKVAFNLRDWSAAALALRKSVEVDPSQDEAWSKLGDALMRQEDYGGAVAAYQRTIQISPNDKQAQFHLKVAARRNRPEAWLTRFRDALQTKNIEAASDILEMASRAHPDNLIITNRLAKVRYELVYSSAVAAVAKQDWENAAELLREIDPGYRGAGALLSRVQATLDSIRTRKKMWRTVVQRQRQPRDGATNRLKEIRPKAMSPDFAAAILDKPSPAAASSGPDQSTIVPGVRAGKAHSDIASSRKGPSPTASPAGFLTPARTVAPPRTSSSSIRPDPGGSSRLPLILSVLGVVFLLAFLVFRARFYQVAQSGGTALLDETLREQEDAELVPAMRHHSAAKFSGEETFRDRIASETPVTFDPMASLSVVASDTGPGQQFPEDSSLSLLETRTMQGGIKPVRRIGRYLVEREIGRGSMGMVFKAWDPKLDRTVVIKQMASRGQMRATEFSRLKDRLYREARAAGKLNHANIVVIYDVEEESNSSFIVMEYLRGRNLRELLEQQDNGRLPPARTCRIVGQVCQALDFAHQNDIVHRDIKPSNIILLDNDQVKVADFGIAKLPHLGTLTRTGDVVGTPFYMSPEQIEGSHVDGRSDVFSTGVLLYEMLTGKRPFDGESISTVVYKIVNKAPKVPTKENTELPAGFDSLIARALNKKPDERYQTANDFRIALRKLESASE